LGAAIACAHTEAFVEAARGLCMRMGELRIGPEIRSKFRLSLGKGGRPRDRRIFAERSRAVCARCMRGLLKEKPVD
jgi:hypothetical protein